MDFLDYLVVDGYNVINSWNDVFDLNKESMEDCRERLLSMLSNYQGYKKINIIVVFDAHLVIGGTEKIENYDKLTVVYTKENETADNYIERFVFKMEDEYRIRVATSDFLEQRLVLHGGGVRMSSRELKEELLSVTKRNRTTSLNNQYNKTNTIMSNVSPELLKKLEEMRRGKF